MSRQYLSSKRLKISEIPAHPDLDDASISHNVTLSQFIDNLLIEIARVDFDVGFKSHGVWPSKGMHIDMPQPNTAADAHGQVTRAVPVSVDRRMRGRGKEAWCARTSYHYEHEVTYNELDSLLSRNHSINEARYTPSVFDANQLLTWSTESLRGVVDKLEPKYGLQEVEMSSKFFSSDLSCWIVILAFFADQVLVFEMFHRMPKVAGFNILNDRVFYVLVITAHCTQNNGDDSNGAHSFTAQLPVDSKSIRQSNTIVQRSHTKKVGSSIRYSMPASATETALTSAQQKSVGNELTEGSYVSLERLRHAPRVLTVGDIDASDLRPAVDYQHRWDMTTLSDAGGITRLAPKRTTHKETLDAIAADVEYVLRFVAELRRSGQSQNPPTGGTTLSR